MEARHIPIRKAPLKKALPQCLVAPTAVTLAVTFLHERQRGKTIADLVMASRETTLHQTLHSKQIHL